MLSNFSFTFIGNGAPPDKQYFTEERSYLSRKGELFIALYIAGTAGKTLGFFFAIIFNASFKSKRGIAMISSALITLKFITAVIAKT